MSCPFCSVEEQRMIYDDQHAYVLFSNPRLMPGHLLVIPKRHVKRIADLSRDERDEAWNLLVKYQDKILENIAAGCDIRQNYRPFMPQSQYKVDHLHFHLQPRDLKDELYEKCQVYETSVFQPLNDEEIAMIKQFL